MSDTNIVVEVGRLTRDGELKYTSGGTALLNLSIAVNRSIPPRDGQTEWKNEVSFFDVQAWGKLAESKAKSMVKGKQVAVKGELRQDRWEQDGASRSKVYIVAESIQPLSDPRAKDEHEEATSPGASAPAQRPATAAAAPHDDFPDDIPF